ncbi:hypothetical protein MTsPCn3_32470 [Erythrobacter sp. MTPC3]
MILLKDRNSQGTRRNYCRGNRNPECSSGGCPPRLAASKFGLRDRLNMVLPSVGLPNRLMQSKIRKLPRANITRVHRELDHPLFGVVLSYQRTSPSLCKLMNHIETSILCQRLTKLSLNMTVCKQPILGLWLVGRDS